MEKIPFSLNHTIESNGESFGPHENKPTPVALILTVLMLQGMRKGQALAEIEKMKSGSKEAVGTFEKIPFHDKLVAFGLESFQDVADYQDLTEIDGVGKKSRDKILEYVDEHGDIENEKSDVDDVDSQDETDSDSGSK